LSSGGLLLVVIFPDVKEEGHSLPFLSPFYFPHDCKVQLFLQYFVPLSGPIRVVLSFPGSFVWIFGILFLSVFLSMWPAKFRSGTDDRETHFFFLFLFPSFPFYGQPNPSSMLLFGGSSERTSVCPSRHKAADVLTFGIFCFVLISEISCWAPVSNLPLPFPLLFFGKAFSSGSLDRCFLPPYIYH